MTVLDTERKRDYRR